MLEGALRLHEFADKACIFCAQKCCLLGQLLLARAFQVRARGKAGCSLGPRNAEALDDAANHPVAVLYSGATLPFDLLGEELSQLLWAAAFRLKARGACSRAQRRQR